jgi:hypothetical protein
MKVDVPIVATTHCDSAKIAETLGKTVLRFDVKSGANGVLFGSVTPTDVADALWEQHKLRVDRRKIGIDTIKRIGRYQVPIELFQDVTAEVRTLVVPEGGELPPEEELEAMEAAERAEQEPSADAAEEAGLDEADAATLAQDPVVSDAEEIEPTPADVAGELPDDEFDRVDPDATAHGQD